MDENEKFEFFYNNTKFQKLCDEVISGENETQVVFAVLPWSVYNRLEGGGACVFKALEEAENYAGPDDQIVTAVLGQAARLVAAFNIMGAAAWTPNQTQNESDDNAIIIEVAKKVLSRETMSISGEIERKRKEADDWKAKNGPQQRAAWLERLR